MKIFLIVLSIIVLVSVFMACKDSVSGNLDSENSEFAKLKPLDIEKYRKLAAEAKSYGNEHKLNKDYFLLVDLGLHSGLERFFGLGL
jgi:hypothetical protein